MLPKIKPIVDLPKDAGGSKVVPYSMFILCIALIIYSYNQSPSTQEHEEQEDIEEHEEVEEEN